jgi:hypothetical protein
MIQHQAAGGSGAPHPRPRRWSDSGQISHSNQAVCGRCQREHPPDSIQPSESRFALERNRLQPAEDFLDTLALPLAHGVAFVLRSSPINGAPPVGRILRYMGVTCRLRKLATNPRVS